MYRGLECCLPSLYGAGRSKDAESLRNHAAGLILLLTVGFCVILSVSCLLGFPNDTSTKLLVLLAGGLTASTILLGLGSQDLRSRKSTLLSGSTVFARSILSLLLGATLATRYSYVGVLIAETTVTFLLSVLVTKHYCRNFRFEFRG